MISTELKDKSLWIYISDTFTIDNFNEFQAAHQNADYDDIVIDFSNTQHIDSGGLGMLLQLRTQLGEDADKITLHSPTDSVRKIFEIVNFDKLFHVA
ncbi:MAG: STAS domain-containing protein [Hydrogenovibrio sp.]|nr:STAS domain-containing protein [Hydrogenovibrio sp.]